MVPLTHSPADVVAQAFIDAGIGVLPSPSFPDWSCHVHVEPDFPDKVLTVKDSQGRSEGREMLGPVNRRWGIQVFIRAGVSEDGYEKCCTSILPFMETGANGMNVTVGGVNYRLHCFSDIGDPIPVGFEQGVSNRFIYTINATVLVKRR